MAPTEHQQLIQLLCHHPEVTLPGLAPELGLPPGPVQILGSDANQAKPVERRADLVLQFGTGEEARAVIVEVQTRHDPRKSWTWPHYLTSLRDTHTLQTCLVVLTLDPSVERLAALPIPTGHPDFTLKPIVLGPTRIPNNPQKVASDPFQAILSVMAHGRGPHGLELALAAFSRLEGVDEAARREYAPVVVRSLLPRWRELLEAIMLEQDNSERTFIEEWIDKARLQGHQEGRQEGQYAMVEALIDLATLRWPSLPLHTIHAQAATTSLPALRAAFRLVCANDDTPDNHQRLQSILTSP